jgi:hypothetical protein
MIPNVVFAEEARHLTPVPTLSKPPAPKIAIVRKTNVVHYLQNRYEVPQGTYRPGRNAVITVDEAAGTVTFSDEETGEHFATHNIEYAAKGRKISLPKHALRFTKTKLDELIAIVKALFKDIELADAYIDELLKKYPRHAKDQLRIMKKCAEDYTPDELQTALDYCVLRDLFSANDFRDTLIFFRTDEPKVTARVLLPAKYLSVQAQTRNLDRYSQMGQGVLRYEPRTHRAFQAVSPKRCGGAKVQTEPQRPARRGIPP